MMGNRVDNQHEADQRLSSTYHAIAIERSPEPLNAAIIDSANRAASAGHAHAWYRPLAFVTTAGLALVLILNLTDAGLTGISHGPTESPQGVTRVKNSAFRDAAGKAASQVRQIETRTDSAMTPSTAPPPDAGPGPDVGSANAGSILPAEESCTDEQRTNSGTWWACIQALEKRGLTRSAARELQALLEAFPQFSEPR